jgi:hypothetical protein
MEDVGKFYGHWVYFWSFGIILLVEFIFPVLACCTKKNLATLNVSSPISLVFKRPVCKLHKRKCRSVSY